MILATGKSSEWFTPPEIFDALDLTFDLDPCSPGPDHWVPARKIYTKEDDGLAQLWDGLIFMNPPFGGRNGVIPWLRKFMCHRNGIAICQAYTSAGWFHKYAVLADAMLFPKGKTRFITADGTIGMAPASGIAILACGDQAVRALKHSGLGFFFISRPDYTLKKPPLFIIGEAFKDMGDFDSLGFTGHKLWKV